MITFKGIFESPRNKTPPQEPQELEKATELENVLKLAESVDIVK